MFAMNDEGFFQNLINCLERDLRGLKEDYKRLRWCVNVKDEKGEFVDFTPVQMQAVEAHVMCINDSACNLFNTLDVMEDRAERITRKKRRKS